MRIPAYPAFVVCIFSILKILDFLVNSLLQCLCMPTLTLNLCWLWYFVQKAKNRSPNIQAWITLRHYAMNWYYSKATALAISHVASKPATPGYFVQSNQYVNKKSNVHTSRFDNVIVDTESSSPIATDQNRSYFAPHRSSSFFTQFLSSLFLYVFIHQSALIWTFQANRIVIHFHRVSRCELCIWVSCTTYQTNPNTWIREEAKLQMTT